MKQFVNQTKSIMKFKFHMTPVATALVLSFTGLLALQTDLLGGPLNFFAWNDAEVVEPNVDLNPIELALLNPIKLAPLPPENIDTETLWLARVIFSESKRVDEQALVAWVVRNRVDSRYRGKRSYEGVALDPHQFSAFSADSTKRAYYSNLTARSTYPGWQTALRVAYEVRHAEGSHRPFSLETRHFYSERSRGDSTAPDWAIGRRPVEIGYELVKLDVRRFRFFEGIS